MAEAGVSDKFAQVKGFRVDIDGAGGKGSRMEARVCNFTFKKR